MAGKPKVLLDASAVLAWLQQEPGSDKVDAVLDCATITSINAAEVVHKLMAKGVNVDRAWEIFDQVCLTVTDFTAEMSRESSCFSDHKGLSLGDRACLGAGVSLGLRILSADRRWAALTQVAAGLPQVEIIRGQAYLKDSNTI